MTDDRPHAQPGSGGTGGRLRGSRAGRHRTRRTYFLLFGLLIADIVVIGLAGTSPAATFSYAPLTAAVVLVALRASRVARRWMVVALVAAAIVVVASAIVGLTGSTHLNGYVYLLLFALLLVSPIAIGRRILTSRQVTLELLVGAICVYLMIGLLFTFVFLGVNGVHPDFFAQGQQKDPSIYLYFSFITMTTVGYGDFTPGADVPRVLAVLEAMLGQVFLVTAVARLVSLYSTPPRPESDGATGDADDHS